MQPLRGSYASWGQDGAWGCGLGVGWRFSASQGEKGREDSPYPGSPSRCLRWGSRRLSSAGCSPYPMAPRQRLKSGSWRAFPTRSFLSGTGEGGGPSAAPDVPSPNPVGQLQPRGPSHFLRPREDPRCLAAASSCVSQAPGPGGGLESPCAVFLASLCPPPTRIQGLWLLQLQSLALLLHQSGQRCPLIPREGALARFPSPRAHY